MALSLRGALQTRLMFDTEVWALTGFPPPLTRGTTSGRSFEPILAILLFSCTLALHARQVDVKLRLDYLWASQARRALSAPLGEGGVPWERASGGRSWL